MEVAGPTTISLLFDASLAFHNAGCQAVFFWIGTSSEPHDCTEIELSCMSLL